MSNGSDLAKCFAMCAKVLKENVYIKKNNANSVFVYFLCRYKPLFCVHLITDVVKYGVYIVVGYFLSCVQETVWKGGCL